MADETMTSVNSVQDLIPAISRVLMSVPFIWTGYMKLVAAGATQAFFAHLGLPVPMAAWGVAVVIEFLGGIALLLGAQARIVASGLAAWCIATALVAHSNFADPNALTHFLKNVVMAGGFLYVATFGAGGYTVQRIFGGRA